MPPSTSHTRARAITVGLVLLWATACLGARPLTVPVSAVVVVVEDLLGARHSAEAEP